MANIWRPPDADADASAQPARALPTASFWRHESVIRLRSTSGQDPADGRKNTMYDVTIEVSGKEHSGKTSVIAAVAKHLESLGVKVILQRIDPQLDEKLTLNEHVLDRLKNTTVFIREMQTPI
jgi:hypothetical protein